MKSTAEILCQTILLVDDDDDFRKELQRMLVVSGFSSVETASDGVAALERLKDGGICVLLLDMVMPGISGAELLGIITERYATLPVIMITAVSDVRTVVSSIKTGAFDYLTKPLDSGRLFATVTNALKFSKLNNQNRQLRNFLMGEPLANAELFAEILTVNSRMKSIFKLAETVAATDQPVLICGETGVGKELLARAIHAASGFAGELVAVNVAGLDEQMFSDTLFGHKKGAFTGAGEGRDGLIKKAEGGTLFLDEIGDLSSGSQMALLRLLQEKEYYRLGSDSLYRSNARIIAATSRDLHSLIETGAFRRDLYHRLATYEILLPPLRERRDDIPLLARHFAREAAVALGRSVPVIEGDVYRALMAHNFPGNIRELQNRISNAVARNSSGVLTLHDFEELAAATPRENRVSGLVRIRVDSEFTLQAVFDSFPTIAEMEQLLVQEALKIANGSKVTAAELLGISRPTLNKKLAQSEAEGDE